MKRNRVHYMLAPEEAALIEACARDFDSRHTHLRPMGRYGHSGSSLFIARFDKQGDGADYVVKITPSDKLEREWRGLPRARQYFPDAVLKQVRADHASGPGATLSRLFRQASDSIVELEDLVLNDAYSGTDVAEILNSVYEDLDAPHRSQGSRAQSYGSRTYTSYLRSRRRDTVLDRFGDTASVELFGACYPNPVKFLRRLRTSGATAPWGFIHGDLHPKNVVIGEAGKPALIDFAWASVGDITLDFVLMECSIRFLLFPQNVDWGLHRRVNERLLDAAGAEAIADIVDAATAHAEKYRKMAIAVSAIRRQARQHSGKAFDWDHYLRCQYIVLYGLAKVPNYPFFHVVDTLGLLSRRLADAEAPASE